jgi:putative transposase
VDNLTGFTDAVNSVFPEMIVQSCIVYQTRNSLKYVASKYQKAFMKELKPLYQAESKERAEVELNNLELNWGEQYPLVIKSWRDYWHKLSAYFKYTDAIRRLIYTTNTVEGYHRQIRKVTKKRGVFTDDTALEKLVYLAYRNIRKKWTMPLKDWGQTAQQMAILFPERFKLFD